MKPVVFLNSHPIQYFAPLYQQFNVKGSMKLTVWYCSDESISGKMDKGFGEKVKWDIPLLEGYHSVFIKNHSWKPSIHKGFWGLFNPGIILMLYKQPRSVLIIHGWAYATNIIAIIFGKIFGHTICLRGETPLNQELNKNSLFTTVKYSYLRSLFIFINHFLYIGKQNKLFYRKLHVKEDKLLFVPYAVDNNRFRKIFNSTDKRASRVALQLPVDKKIILYSGKYIKKKRPLDLLKAFNEIAGSTDACLVMVGEGDCRSVMENYINDNELNKRVVLTGFINQSLIPAYYRAADIFVMCSGIGETWGLSVNEAMNFGLPVIVSDTCGAAYDLVESGKNGEVFETGNIHQLASTIQKYLQISDAEINLIEKAALQKIDHYSYDQIINAIESIQ